MRIALRYSPDALRRDAVAALTVTAIALPQGMAYALLAGVDPRYGLYSTIVVTAVASVFGSSSHLINGPTSAISLVVFAALSIFDPDQRVEAAEAMFLLGVMVGSIQILIATFRLGDLTRYISESVILGFMSAAALLLAIGQVSNALGVRDKGTGAQHILHRLWLTLTTGDPVNVKAVITAVATLAFAIAFRVSAHPRVLTDGEWASCEVVGCRRKIVDAITGDSIQASGGPVPRPQLAQSDRKGCADPGVVETA